MTPDQISEIVNDISLPDSFEIIIKPHVNSNRWYLQIRQDTLCNRTGEPYNEGGRKWDLSEYMTKSEIVLTAWKAYLTFLEHEARETFLYKGAMIFDPHIDIDALLVACKQRSVRNEKSNMETIDI